MHLAAVNQRMSLDETLAAATINSAHSIGRSKTHGSIEKGKVADLVVIDAPRLEITK
jgi:urease alpha subunit